MKEEIEKQYLVVGLGNPGKKYALTRHNMGYLVVQAFAETLGWKFKEEKQFQANVTKGKVEQSTLHLMLPLTYMNESGKAVRSYMDFYKLNPSQLIVIVDDIAIGFGEIRIRNVGGPGGHNGLKSIEGHIHTQHYVRVRMGIGEEPHDKTLTDHVLDTFNSDEKFMLEEFIKNGVVCINRLIRESVSIVMNAINVRRKNKLTEEAQKGQVPTRDQEKGQHD